MSDATNDAALASGLTTETELVLRAQERLRQDVVIFNIRQKQNEKMFTQRQVANWTAIGLLPMVAVLCGYVLLAHDRFPDTVVTIATSALLVDILGLVGTLMRGVAGRTPPELRRTVDD
jgi:hypothetical protein